jgi:hypothetical protein
MYLPVPIDVAKRAAMSLDISDFFSERQISEVDM